MPWSGQVKSITAKNPQVQRIEWNRSVFTHLLQNSMPNVEPLNQFLIVISYKLRVATAVRFDLSRRVRTRRTHREGSLRTATRSFVGAE
jgi:hypothetical protein